MDSAIPHVVLSGISPHVQGLHWKAEQRLAIGRQSNLDIVLEGPAIARKHAEVIATSRGWMVRDLGSHDGTFLNGLPVDQEPRKLQLHDVLHCGQVAFRVTTLQEGGGPGVILPLPEKLNIKTTRSVATVKSATQRSWEQGLQALTGDQPHLPHSKNFFALVRAGYHLCRIHSLKELLQSILDDTVTVFNARHGAILLRDETTGEFALRAFAPQPLSIGQGYSLTLTQRCFNKRESFLCSDSFQSKHGECAVDHGRASIICALLRSPRKRLGVLHLDRGPDQDAFTNDDLQLADALAASISAGVECAQLVEKHREPFLQKTAAFMRRAIELRDPHTGRHMQRVQTYANWLAAELNLHPEDCKHLHIGALLHDIGKIAVGDAVLQKPLALTEDEFALMKEQTLKGAALAEILPDLEPILPIIRSHHERWDGTGYPDGLAGDSIPLLARIVAVADAFDAMTAPQPYRPARSLDEALAELRAGAGHQFDPTLVEIFLTLRPRLENSLQVQAS